MIAIASWLATIGCHLFLCHLPSAKITGGHRRLIDMWLFNLLSQFCDSKIKIASHWFLQHPNIFVPRELSIEKTFATAKPKIVIVGEGTDGEIIPALASHFDKEKTTPQSIRYLYQWDGYILKYLPRWLHITECIKSLTGFSFHWVHTFVIFFYNDTVAMPQRSHHLGC